MTEQINEQETRMVRFQDVAVVLHEHDGQMWMTGEDIGRCLGYAEPRRSVKNIYDRHKEELDPLSVGIKLMSTDGKAYITRVFNEQGSYIITMFAKTDRAKDLRAWLANLPKTLREMPDRKPGPELEAIAQIARAVTDLGQMMNQMMGHMTSHLVMLTARMDNLERAAVTDYRPAVSGTRLLRRRKSISHITTFLDDACVRDPEAYYPPPELYEGYRMWCDSQGLKPLGKQYFYDQLRKDLPRLPKHRIGTREYFGGIRLAEPAPIPPASEPPVSTGPNYQTIQEFIETACDVGYGFSSVKGVLYAAYRTWCEENEIYPEGRNFFFRGIEALLPQTQPAKGSRSGRRTTVIRGIRARKGGRHVS